MYSLTLHPQYLGLFRKKLPLKWIALSLMLFIFSVASVRGLIAQEKPSLNELQEVTDEKPEAEQDDMLFDDREEEGVERTLFDLYASDSFTGGILANYTDAWCEVDDPIGALEQLPNIRTQRLEDARSLLLGRIEKERSIEGIGRVLCDIYTFRLVIELEPQFFTAETMGLPGYLPSPEGGFSFQQNLGFAATREVSGTTQSAFTHRSVIGKGRYFGRFTGATRQDGSYELLEASSYGYIGDFEFGAGFIETTGQTFTNSLQFLGLRAKTSDKVLLDPQDGRGSVLQIFVPSRARVEFYRAGRLLTVQLLDFGLQEIDTSRFPQGSYDVDVVITETNGDVTTDRKFFTKSGYLTIRGRPSYDFQVGVTREEFSLEQTPVAYGGVQWRASDYFDLGGSIYGTDRLAVAQAQMNGIYRDTFFQGSSSLSTRGDAGINGNISYTFLNAMTLSVSGAKTIKISNKSRLANPSPAPLPEEEEETTNFIADRQRLRELLFQDRSFYSVRLRKGIGALSFNYQMQGERVGNGLLRRSRGPAVGWQVYEDGKNFVRLNAQVFETERGGARSGTLSYRRRFTPEWSFNSQVGYYDREEQEEVVGLLTLNYVQQKRAMYDSRLSLSSEARKRNGNLGEDGNGMVYSHQLTADYGGDYLYGRGFIRNQQGGSAGSSSFGINAETAVIVGNGGTAALSYPMAQEAVFIANLKGNIPGRKFELLLNNQRYDTITSGKRSAISVPPFQIYKVSIRPTNPNELIDYDTTSYRLTFYPGNVIEKTWEMVKITIILGRLVDEDGNPIALQRLKGTREYVATDSEGYFQAELAGDEELSVEVNGKTCIPEMPSYQEEDFFTDLGDVICK